MQLGNPLQIVCQMRAMVRLALGKGILLRQMRMWQMINPTQQGAKHLAIGNNAADGYAAKIHPVIPTLTPDQAGAASIAAHLVIGKRRFQRCLDRFRA